MRPLIRQLDRTLCRRLGIFEFSGSPDCVFRARLLPAPHPLAVPGGMVAAGEPVLELHLWNERIPPLPGTGASMAWAARGARLMRTSLNELAQLVSDDRRFAGVAAVGGSTWLFSGDGGLGGSTVLERMGFQVCEHPVRGVTGLSERLYGWALMWSYNPVSACPGRLRSMRRTTFWATREQFLAKHRRRSR
jgi:hypothetical protein